MVAPTQLNVQLRHWYSALYFAKFAQNIGAFSALVYSTAFRKLVQIKYQNKSAGTKMHKCLVREKNTT